MCKQMARFPNALLCKIPPKTTCPQIKRLIVDSALLWNCVFYFSCFSNQHCWHDERVRWWFCSLSTATKERLPHRDTKAKLPRQGSKPGKPIGLDKASSVDHQGALSIWVESLESLLQSIVTHQLLTDWLPCEIVPSWQTVKFVEQ